jgi:hypothetical protein
MIDPNNGAANAAFVELEIKLLRVTRLRMSRICRQTGKLATLKSHHFEEDRPGAAG